MSAAMRPGLTVRDATKSYGATVALEHVSLHLASGQVHALLGENGAGKSTLVKILSGVVRPDEGEMQLDGTPYRPQGILEARRAGVATAFQELSLPANLSVAESLLMPRLSKGPAGLVSARRTAAAPCSFIRPNGPNWCNSPTAALSSMPAGSSRRSKATTFRSTRWWRR